MIAVLDTSALLKLLFDEAETAELRRFLRSSDDTMAVSTVARVEMRRATIRVGVPSSAVVPILEPMIVIALTDSILNLAARLPERHLGTLDALHLASALSVEAGAFVTYDQRQARAARAEGLLVHSPGQDA